jgi:hypothetical protein
VTWLYNRIGTFITLLMLLALTPPPLPVGPARHVPTTSSYENLSDLPLNVGGKLSGSLMV